MGHAVAVVTLATVVVVLIVALVIIAGRNDDIPYRGGSNRGGASSDRGVRADSVVQRQPTDLQPRSRCEEAERCIADIERVVRGATGWIDIEREVMNVINRYKEAICGQ